ncbi:RNA polymerase Rpb5 domain-containing protein [Colletotrichum higginsianum]|nr:RNA polymerase Rpb5 domain-containing protein [Colletotrichum higginsianum]
MSDQKDVNKEVTRLWRAWRTAHEMAADRGYELAEDELKISLDRFKMEYTAADGSPWEAPVLREPLRRHDSQIYPPPTSQNPNPTPDCGTLWVEFLADTTFGIKEIKKFIHHLISNKYSSGIMVTHVPLSPAARKMLITIESFAKVECFLEEDLLVNITQHELVPKHILLSREEKVALLKRYRLKETQLPRILQKDPVAKYLGLKRGQVVKIIRTSETAGRYASYRLCV